jgi:hypothetical protein
MLIFEIKDNSGLERDMLRMAISSGFLIDLSPTYFSHVINTVRGVDCDWIEGSGTLITTLYVV